MSKTGELTVVPETGPSPDDLYPPKGTPETAIVITLTEDQNHVVHHTGRYFHAQVECAGYQGEEVGIDDVPDEPGDHDASETYWVAWFDGPYQKFQNRYGFC